MSNITIEGYRQMQARTIALLLRYDEGRFRQLIDNRAGSGVQLAQLSTYRDLAVMFQLQNSLFEDIVPRIIRRLSFESPTTRELEELPARGRINWERTLQQSWNEFPGETPLQVHTRTRRRDFATPENLLTIITLLEYSQHAQYLLEQERIQIGDEALRHPLHTIIENCERTLNFPQFAALRSTAQKILDNGETEQLEAQLIERHHQESSAYSHLLEWRQQYRSLQLLEYGSAPDEDVVGADPKRDNYLYQLWLFYELLDMLQREQCIESFESNPLRLRFRWGAESTLYELRHDQERPVLWDNSPKVRPDYYIYRVDRTELRDGDRLIWHEPGYILDAKYYLPHDSDAMYSEARKRMLADLQLLGERHGALLFAYSHSEQTPDDAEQRPHQLGRLHAKTDTGFNLSQHIQIDGWQIPPHSAANGAAYLRTVLDRVHAQLATSIPIACHGVIGDVDTIRPGSQANATCPTCNGPLAYCPKPHVGPQHIDRVCTRCDCLSNKQVCHIIGQDEAFLPPMVQRTLTTEDLSRNIEELKQWLNKHASINDTSEQAEQLRTQILNAIGARVDSFTKFNRVDLTSTRNNFRQWVFGDYWDTNSYQLSEQAREMLVSGEYIWNEVKDVRLEDWAACAVQYLRAFEYELHRRVYDVCNNQLIKQQYSKVQPMKPNEFTFGSLGGIYNNRTNDTPPFRNATNWSVLLEYVAKPMGLSEADFGELCRKTSELAKSRNEVAHTKLISREKVQEIRDRVLGKLNQPGELLQLCQQLRPAGA